MSGAEFIDTNIWVYAHQETPDDPRSALAWEVIETLTIIDPFQG